MKNVRRQYFILLLLVFLFAAPGLSAYFFYFHPHWLSAPPTNKGTFIRPPILLTDLGHDSKWRLVLWSPTACEASCVEQLDKLARIRLALGRRLYEVESCLLLSANAKPITSALAAMLREHDIHVKTLSHDASAHLSASHPDATVFIANPDDYLVLIYQWTAESDDIFHDIKQLLTKG